MKTNYKISLWPGMGYVLDGPFTVTAEDLDDAMDMLAVKLIKENLTDYFLTWEQYDELCRDCGIDTETDDFEGYQYIDATMAGADYPIFLNIENMIIEEVAA